MHSFIYFFVSLGEKHKPCKNFMNQIIRWNWKKSSEDWLADRTQIKWPHCTRNSWHQLARSIQWAGHAVDNLFTTTLLYIKLCALNLVKLDKTRRKKQICSAEDCLKTLSLWCDSYYYCYHYYYYKQQHDKKTWKKNLGKDKIILKKQNKIAALKAENKNRNSWFIC